MATLMDLVVICATFCGTFCGLNWVERHCGKRAALLFAVVTIIFCAAWYWR